MNQRDLSIPTEQEGDDTQERLVGLLSAVVAASRCMVEHQDLYQGLTAALAELGRRTGSDRAYAFELRDGGEICEVAAEWAAPGVGGVVAQVGTVRFPVSDYLEVWRPLRAGEPYQSVTPARSGANAALNTLLATRSDLMVPVMADGACWGCIGLDNCREERRYSDAEIQVLSGAADAVAAAWLRRRAEAAERAALAESMARAEADAAALREREGLLRTATQTAQALLGGTDFEAGVAQALGCLGEALAVERVGLVEHLGSPQTGDDGRWRCSYEWAAPGRPCQMDSDAAQGDAPNATWALEQRAGQVSVLHVGDNHDAFDVGQARLQVAAILSVPVFVRGAWWGSLCFDRNPALLPWPDHEVAMLQTAAACVGAAMERRDAEARRLAAERERADEAEALNRLLEGVVLATRELLDATDFIAGMQRWLGQLGTAAGADMAFFIDAFEDPASGSVAHWRVHWRRDG